MTLEARKEYYRAIVERTKNASKWQKCLILNEFCINCGYSRKYAIRLLNKLAQKRILKPGRKQVYGQEAISHVKKLWLLMDQLCSN